jgi:hypothetical protein
MLKRQVHLVRYGLGDGSFLVTKTRSRIGSCKLPLRMRNSFGESRSFSSWEVLQQEHDAIIPTATEDLTRELCALTLLGFLRANQNSR